MIKVYERSDLKNAIDRISYLLSCEEQREINGLHSLTFTMKVDNQSVKYFNEDDNTKYLFKIDGRFYYFISKDLDTDTQQIKVICRSVITLMDKLIFIPIYPIQVNQTAEKVMRYVLDTFQNIEEEGIHFEFKLFTSEELRSKGMKWVSEPFDILNGFDYVTGYDMIGNVMKLAGRGELYFENFKFAIVERIGEDKDITWDKDNNINSLKINKNYDEIMNIILVEGKEGMPLDIKQFPNSIITDTESIQKYGVRKGRLFFNDIDNKDDLKRRAMWEIDEANPERVSVPKETVSCDAYNIENVNLGDSVRIKSRYDKIDAIKRITTHTINWLERAEDKFILGDKALTELQLLAKLEASRQTLSNITDTNGEVDTTLINLITSAIEGRNRCNNSKFSIFDKYAAPLYWKTQNGFVTEQDSRFGGYCLSLVDNGIAISDTLNISNWEEESDMTLIQVWHKGSFEIYVEGQNENGEYDELNPVIIPHSTKYSSSKLGRSQFSSMGWSTTPGYLVVDNQDIPDNGNFRIIIQGVTQESVKIGGVYIGPGNLSQIKLYSDGPHSDRFEEDKQQSDVLFNREKNKEDIEILSQEEKDISNIQLEASSYTQLNMELLTVLEGEDEILNVNLNVYDNEDLKYSYPVKILGAGQNTFSLGRILETLEEGAHILNFRIKNLGTNLIKVLKEQSVFSLHGKFVEMAEVPPIPVINESDYLIFRKLWTAEDYLNTFKNDLINIFDMNEELRFSFSASYDTDETEEFVTISVSDEYIEEFKNIVELFNINDDIKIEFNVD